MNICFFVIQILFIRHSQKPVKFAEISDAYIIVIDKYNSRKRITIESSNINDLDLLMTNDSHLHGCYGSILRSYFFIKSNIYF